MDLSTCQYDATPDENCHDGVTHQVQVQVVRSQIRERGIDCLFNILGLVMCVPQFAGQLDRVPCVSLEAPL